VLQGRPRHQINKHVRDRSRERRRSSSPDSPPSPPLPDITVPFYMLPRSDEPEVTIPPTSRPQLVSYPHLANTGHLPTISYPVPQTQDSTTTPLVSYPPLAAQKLDNSAVVQSEMAAAPGNGADLSHAEHEQYRQLSYQPPPSRVL